MHLTVISVPVAAVLLILGAVRPLWFSNHRWLSTAMAAVAFVSTIVTNNTGGKLMVFKGASEENPGIYADHALYAKFVLISVGVLFVGTALRHFLEVKEMAPAVSGWPCAFLLCSLRW